VSVVWQLIGTFLLVLVLPLIFIHTESLRHDIYEALAEVSSATIFELPPVNGTAIEPGDIVHGSSHDITSSVTDPGLGIIVDNALALHRNTEFCQWFETRSESCKTCSRAVWNENGKKETENYECDCTISFHYIKTWLPYLVNSFLFDQPAAHYNPLRNPFPSSLFVAQDASMIFSNSRQGTFTKARISPDLLHPRIQGATPRLVKWVRNGIPRAPPLWRRWIPDRSRYENISLFKHLNYGPLVQEGFVYVGDGYFFSPYELSKMERLLKVFGEYVEGTLFDWQLGDIMPSCTAGDVRITYTVEDPDTVSVLGQVAALSPNAEIFIKTIKTENGHIVGLVHEGVMDAYKMIEEEDVLSWRIASIFRLLTILWAFVAVRRIGTISGYDVGKFTFLQQVMVTSSLWSFLVGIAWSRIWGSTVHSRILTSLSLVLIPLLLRDPPPRLKRDPELKESGRPSKSSQWDDTSEWTEG